METITRTTINVYRYQCSDCKAKSYLPDFRNAGMVNCPFCGAEGLTYDRPLVFLLEKGKSKRKVCFISLFRNNEGQEFYVDQDPGKTSKHDMFSNKRASHVKDIQTFGIQKEMIK